MAGFRWVAAAAAGGSDDRAVGGGNAASGALLACPRPCPPTGDRHSGEAQATLKLGRSSVSAGQPAQRGRHRLGHAADRRRSGDGAAGNHAAAANSSVYGTKVRAAGNPAVVRSREQRPLSGTRTDGALARRERMSRRTVDRNTVATLEQAGVRLSQRTVLLTIAVSLGLMAALAFDML